MILIEGFGNGLFTVLADTHGIGAAVVMLHHHSKLAFHRTTVLGVSALHLQVQYLLATPRVLKMLDLLSAVWAFVVAAIFERLLETLLTHELSTAGNLMNVFCHHFTNYTHKFVRGLLLLEYEIVPP